MLNSYEEYKFGGHFMGIPVYECPYLPVIDWYEICDVITRKEILTPVETNSILIQGRLYVSPSILKSLQCQSQTGSM